MSGIVRGVELRAHSSNDHDLPAFCTASHRAKSLLMAAVCAYVAVDHPAAIESAIVMRTHEIENWGLSVIDRVKAGQPNEDQRVELKAEWPDPYKAARRIGGHGNSAGGEYFIWLIGVDEKRGVEGVKMTDLASWYAQVESEFQGIAPSMRPVNIPVDGKTVVALLFHSDRAPYVVKIKGTDKLEVPWRGSTSIRSARRDELLRILSPRQKLPSLKVQGVQITGSVATSAMRTTWTIKLQCYIVPHDAARLVIPDHRCRGNLSFPERNINVALLDILLRRIDSTSPSITATLTEIILDGPAVVELIARAESTANWYTLPPGEAHLTIDFYPAGSDQPATVSIIAPPSTVADDKWEIGDLRASKN